MHHEALEGIFGKVERAESHIQELNSKFNAYVQANPYVLASEINSDRTEEVWRYKLVRKIPGELNTIAGDAFYNLRSALDNLVGALAIQAGKTPNGCSFLFGETAEKFELAVLDKAKKVPEAHDIIRELKAHKTGNPVLWLLHRINLNDKHFVPLRVNLANGLIMTQVSIWDGKLLILGPRDERHMTVGGYVPGRRWSGQKHDLEILTLTPGTKFKTDFQLIFNITIRNIAEFEGESVIAVLYQARQAVERILTVFGSTFFQ